MGTSQGSTEMFSGEEVNGDTSAFNFNSIYLKLIFISYTVTYTFFEFIFIFFISIFLVFMQNILEL